MSSSFKFFSGIIRCAGVAIIVLTTFAAKAQTPEPLGTARHLIYVTLDGMRWQEIFGGADPTLIDPKAGGVRNVAVLRQSYLTGSAEEKRARLMPFLWGTVVKNGQIFGDRTAHCIANVANPFHFSYPGYSEMLCGFVEPKINSNDDVLNPNPTVLEWLNQRDGFTNRVAAYGSWDRLRAIVNPARSKIPVMAGWQPIVPSAGLELSERERTLNDLLAHSSRYWADEPFDSIIQEAALEYFRRHQPRVFYVMLGETDEWAHGRRYDLYLQAAQRADEFISRLWSLAQSMPGYAGNTALVISTDHGRGATADDWTSHGDTVPGSEGVWIAVMGPNTPALGIRRDVNVTQSQIAATLAGLLGEDYPRSVSRAAKMLPGVIGPMRDDR